jgi:hypothetical protein
MKNAGLPPLDMIEMKHRDKDYKRRQAIYQTRSKLIWKQFNSRGARISLEDYQALEDRLDTEVLV